MRRLGVAIVAIALCAGAADGQARRTRIGTCCYDVAASSGEHCGAGGYGFRFERRQPSRVNRKEADEEHTRPVWWLVCAVWLVAGFAVVVATRVKERSTAVKLQGTALAVGALAASSAWQTALGPLDPIGWYRVSSMFALILAADLMSHRSIGGIQHPSRDKWHQLANIGFFVAAAYAQEKLLWRTEYSVSIPLFGMVLRMCMGQLCNPAVATLTSLLLTLVLVTITQPFVPMLGGGLNAPARLYATLGWPVMALLTSTFVAIAKIPRHTTKSLVACGIALIWGIVLAKGLWELGSQFSESGLLQHQGTNRFCCLDSSEPLSCNRSIQGQATRWFHHSLQRTTVWSREEWAMVFITVFTNFSGVPAAVMLWRTGDVFSSVVGWSTMTFSTIYHFADAINDNVSGMTAGNWHRLDNLFACLSFVNLLLYPSSATQPLEALHTKRSFYLLAIVIMQEIGPWQIECMLLPIGLALGELVLYLRREPMVWQLLSGSQVRAHFYKALLLNMFGIVGFVKGLDEENDWLRCAHSLWHLFTGFAFFFYVKALHQVALQAQAKRAI